MRWSSLLCASHVKGVQLRQKAAAVEDSRQQGGRLRKLVPGLQQ